MSSAGRVLVVEDHEGERRAIMQILKSEGFNVFGAENADKALGYIDENIDVVLSDLQMGDVSGIDLLNLWRQRKPDAQIILLTGHSSVDSAVQAIKAGAYHYVTKPINPDEVTVAAVPSTLVESELFGHVRGAFTGATDRRIGRFEQADGGTLFVDEIGDFELGLQAKLLRVPETLTLTPVGGHEDRKVNVRVVAATSRDLRKMVEEGKFREDLFYRLNVIVINLPPLRQRPDDIPILVDHFLREIAANKHTAPHRVSPEVMRRFSAYRWPGNVRELRNVLESMMVLAEGETLTEKDLPDEVAADTTEGGGMRKEIP